MTARTLLILGGARSGKSRHAQTYAESTGLKCLYVATAQALDSEMAERIDKHKADRVENWSVIEAPLDLPEVIRCHAAPLTVILIDCLTLWTSNLLFAEHDVSTATTELIHALEDANGPVILVSNEVGLGIVPNNALARKFRDAAGIVNQRVAASVDTVQFIAAGLPITLK